KEEIDEYLDIKNKDQREKMSIKQQMSIHNLMRIVFLKRSESSIYALQRTIEFYKERLINFKSILVEKNKIISISDLKKYLELFSKESLNKDEIIEIGELQIDIPPDFKKEEMLNDIDKDLLLADFIIDILKELVKEDDKIKAFSKLIESKIQKGHKKILVFSYFADTINYLKDNISNYCLNIINEKNALFVSSSGNSIKAEKAAELFSPKSKNYTDKFQDWEKEIDFLFTTDVLSEGQNLQDCDVLINYDLH
ncbi:MAG: helicase-related protein, partial [Cyanobium sp. MAG06]|nr:helicase-related protein [Cyanobium sp. MAG06]